MIIFLTFKNILRVLFEPQRSLNEDYYGKEQKEVFKLQPKTPSPFFVFFASTSQFFVHWQNLNLVFFWKLTRFVSFPSTKMIKRKQKNIPSGQASKQKNAERNKLQKFGGTGKFFVKTFFSNLCEFKQNEFCSKRFGNRTKCVATANFWSFLSFSKESFCISSGSQKKNCSSWHPQKKMFFKV